MKSFKKSVASVLALCLVSFSLSAQELIVGGEKINKEYILYFFFKKSIPSL